MVRRRLLISWIGHADLRAFAQLASGRDRNTLLKDVPAGRGDGDGPLKTLLDQVTFDEVHLLSNYGDRKDRAALKALGHAATIHAVQVDNVIDYAELFRVANDEVKRIIGNRKPEQYALCFHLSPGTPQMAAVWLLLGKTRYPATLYQTFSGQVLSVDVPFDIALDVIPEVLKGPDAHLQHLAAKAPSELPGFEAIVGRSKAVRLAVGRAKQAAVRDVPILLTGESGTGKEMFARAIHQASHRADGHFRAVNCAALPRELLEAELFGVKKGAYTGATADRPGLFEEADGGTIFLDEVGECEAAVQAKLLRVLQPPPGKPSSTRTFTRVGDTKERQADIRIIAATNRDLIGATHDGSFREDLLYRLAVITIHLPSLRDRRTDVAELAEALLAQVNREFAAQEPGYDDKSLSARANVFVRRYPWPGNVRQLRNALIQAAVMSAGSVIDLVDIEAAVAGFPGTTDTDVLGRPLGDGFDLDQHLRDIQRHYLRRAMEEAGGVKRRAAALVGMKNYQTLDAQLKRLKVRWRVD